jgi:hypothetical protein
MKNFLLLTCKLLFISNLFAQDGQDMAYNFGYLFKSSRLDSSGKLYLLKDSSLQIIEKIGEFTLNGNTTSITNKKTIKSSQLFRKRILRQLKGTITQRNKDSVFIKFWNITDNSPFKARPDYSNFVNQTGNGEDFVYAIDSGGWKTARLSKGKVFDFPFRFQQITATNLPFRVLTKTGDLESDFLNANASYLFVSGSTRIFKSEFIKPRNRYFAWGPYLGLSSIDNPQTSNKEFGLNYGLNGVFGFQAFNFTTAFGFQNGFKTDTKQLQPYIGFGIGFKLLETFSPEIKNKDE